MNQAPLTITKPQFESVSSHQQNGEKKGVNVHAESNDTERKLLPIASDFLINLVKKSNIYLTTFDF